MKRYIATFAEYDIIYSCKTIIADNDKQAIGKARKMCSTETVKNLYVIDTIDEMKKSTPEEILNLLNKLKKEYNKTHGTIQAKKIDAIIRFYTHLIALDEITEEYIREVVE